MFYFRFRILFYERFFIYKSLKIDVSFYEKRLILNFSGNDVHKWITLHTMHSYVADTRVYPSQLQSCKYLLGELIDAL